MTQHGSERRSKAGTEPVIALRTMAASDLDAILALARETAEAPHWSLEDYERILLCDPSSAFSRAGVVAQSGSQLAGLAVTCLFRLEKVAELETILVHPRFRRRGIGSQLLIASKSFAQSAGATLLRLEVRESNRDAIELYRMHGFRHMGRRRSYYSSPIEDALLLEAPLGASSEATQPG